MKLATFHRNGALALGLVERDEIVDLASASVPLPDDWTALLALGREGLALVKQAAVTAARLPLASVRLGPPIARPRKFLGLGMAYRSHVAELKANGVTIPDHQVWFNKQVTAINGPYDDVHLPRVSEQLDYEGEVALVIGQRARHVRAKDAMGVVAGFMICNDVSVRDWMKRSPTGTLGKSFDTHGPIGPWMTTLDEAPAAEDLRIRTFVDGELRQAGETSDLIYSFGEMIEELTTVFTLEPGDILTTGTPSGVGQGMIPPSWLRAGQRIRVEVDGLGHIENQIVPEPN